MKKIEFSIIEDKGIENLVKNEIIAIVMIIIAFGFYVGYNIWTRSIIDIIIGCAGIIIFFMLGFLMTIMKGQAYILKELSNIKRIIKKKR